MKTPPAGAPATGSNFIRDIVDTDLKAGKNEGRVVTEHLPNRIGEVAGIRQRLGSVGNAHPANGLTPRALREGQVRGWPAHRKQPRRDTPVALLVAQAPSGLVQRDGA